MTNQDLQTLIERRHQAIQERDALADGRRLGQRLSFWRTVGEIDGLGRGIEAIERLLNKSDEDRGIDPNAELKAGTR